MSDGDVNKELREFLEWEKKERASTADDRANLRTAIRETREMRKATERNGEKLDLVASAQTNLLNQFVLHEQKDETRHLEVKESLAGLGARVTVLEKDREDTSNHHVEELKTQLKDERARVAAIEKDRQEARSWWSRNWFLICAGFVSSLIVGGALAGCALALSKVFH